MRLLVVFEFGVLLLKNEMGCLVCRIFHLTISSSGVVSARSAERQRLQRAAVVVGPAGPSVPIPKSQVCEIFGRCEMN
jgi:hypothetical protein